MSVISTIYLFLLKPFYKKCPILWGSPPHNQSMMLFFVFFWTRPPPLLLWAPQGTSSIGVIGGPISSLLIGCLSFPAGHSPHRTWESQSLLGIIWFNPVSLQVKKLRMRVGTWLIAGKTCSWPCTTGAWSSSLLAQSFCAYFGSAPQPWGPTHA